MEDTGSTTLGGEFCGQLSQSHTYLTTSKSVTLYSNAEAKIDHFNAYYDVLSLEAVKRRYPEMRCKDDPSNAIKMLSNNYANFMQIGPSFN